METEEKKDDADAEEKPEETPTAEASFAKIAGALNEIRFAIGFIGLVFVLNQCSGSFRAESDETKALKSIDYSLRILHDDLKRDRDTPSVGAELRQIGTHLSDINSTISYKSCSR